MSKYSQDDLRGMARRLIEARDTGDTRYSTFILLLSKRTGMHYGQCVQLIEALAV